MFVLAVDSDSSASYIAMVIAGKHSKLGVSNFADDICLINKSNEDIQKKTDGLTNPVEQAGGLIESTYITFR